MGCREGPDPADFAPGAINPTDDPSTPIPEISILDATIVSINGQIKAQFPVVLTNWVDVLNISMRWDTADGSALAGSGYYQPYVNQTLSIPAGSSEGTIEVPIYTGTGKTGSKYFLINLSNPVNGSLRDAQGRADWTWEAPPPPPPPPDPINAASFTGWPKPGIVYDQFVGCDYDYACTAATCGAAMSGLFYRNSAGANRAFDWKKLYRDAGGCLACASACTGENPLKMLRWMRDTGIRDEVTGAMRKISSFNELTDTTVSGLVRKIKRVLVDQGVVYLVSPWYSTPNRGWNRCLTCNQSVLRNPDKDGPSGSADSSSTCVSEGKWTNANMPDSGLGHTWILTGWNDSKAGGAFEIQSSHGSEWGAGGRCWIPYSFLKLTSKWRYYKLVYGG